MTRTKPSDFPSLLRQKLSTVQVVEKHRKFRRNESTQIWNVPSVAGRGIRYSEAQLRSADEGSTIFYNCDCGHRLATDFYVCMCPRRFG